MSRPLFFTDPAERDLDAILDYIARDDPRRAAAFVNEIREACERLRAMPFRETSRPDLGGGFRTLFLRHRIVVVYEVTDNDVVILGVFSGGQDYAILFQTEPRPQ